MAPKYTLVPELMDNLFTFMKTEEEFHPLIQSSVFHYELEFIHPFMDGNGRIGRLWQSVILYNYRNIFQYIPIETVIKRRQNEYYEAFRKSQKQGESTVFILFMLETIKQAMIQFSKKVRPSHQSTEIRLQMAQEYFGNKFFTRKEYMDLHQNISPASATRDLAFAVQKKRVQREGELRTTKYRFI